MFFFFFSFSLSLFTTKTTLCEVSRGLRGQRQDEIWLHLTWDYSPFGSQPSVGRVSPDSSLSVGLSPTLVSLGLLLATGVICVIGKCPQIISSFVGLIFGLPFWLQSFIQKLAWKFLKSFQIVDVFQLFLFFTVLSIIFLWFKLDVWSV